MPITFKTTLVLFMSSENIILNQKSCVKGILSIKNHEALTTYFKKIILAKLSVQN